MGQTGIGEEDRGKGLAVNKLTGIAQERILVFFDGETAEDLFGAVDRQKQMYHHLIG